MYTENLPVRTIDLRDEARLRWGHVISSDRRSMRALAKQALADMASISPLLRSPTLHWVFKTFFYNGELEEEIRSLAAGMGVSTSLAVVFNQAYELSHVAPIVPIFGCTTAVKKTNDRGLVLVRNLDWPLSRIGRATRVFRFVDGERSFVSVGIAGYAGVLSGMLPGRYAVCINWAPPLCPPKLSRTSPAILLRQALETCDTYTQAVRMLASTPLSTSVFFTVCGVNEACIIERTQSSGFVRRLEEEALVQSNHFLHRPFRSANKNLDLDGETECLAYSKERAELLKSRLERVKTCQGAFGALDRVRNEDTVQQMVFCPGTGEMKVGRWV